MDRSHNRLTDLVIVSNGAEFPYQILVPNLHDRQVRSRCWFSEAGFWTVCHRHKKFSDVDNSSQPACPYRLPVDNAGTHSLRMRSSQTYEHYSLRTETFKRSFIPFFLR